MFTAIWYFPDSVERFVSSRDSNSQITHSLVLFILGSRAEVVYGNFVFPDSVERSVSKGLKFAKLLVPWFCFVCGSIAEVVYGLLVTDTRICYIICLLAIYSIVYSSRSCFLRGILVFSGLPYLLVFVFV